ncbi:BatA domain-containing protein [Hymenobacter tenuis]
MAFTYPWFLLGLLGIAVPIAIHLFELRRPQRLLFSNVDFIQEIKLVTARQRRIKHLLVLAARIGLIVSLVLLFAQPFIPAPQSSNSTSNTIGVLVDNSPSMRQLGKGDQPVLERAIQEAADLPLAFSASTRFELLPSKQKPLDPAQYRAALDLLQVSGQASVLGAQLEQTQYRGNPGPLFVFSDFQRNNFSAQALQKIDPSRQVFLVPLATGSKPNVFVDSVWLDDAFVRANADLTLHVRLRNGGTQLAENCQTKLFVGRQQAASFRVSVPPQQAVVSQVRIRLTSNEVQKCRVEIEDFPVDFDNTYFFTLQPAAQIRVVEVAAEGTLGQLYGNEPLFGYQLVSPQSADYRKVAAANLIVVREASVLSTGMRESLRRAVQQGATLVVIPAASVNSRESYGQLFRELGLGPVQWLPLPQNGPVLQEVAMPSAQNPFFKDVFAAANPRAGMPKAAPVLRWARSGAEVLRMRDGEGYLSGFSSGSGMVYVFAAPFSAPYSDFAQHPLLVPTMYRLAMQSYQQEQQPAYRLNQPSVSVRLSLSTDARGAEAVYRLVQDSLSFIPVQRTQGASLRLEVPPTLRQPGFYSLQRAGKTVATLAFNFDKRESDLRSYSAADLRQMVGSSHPNVQVYEVGEGQTAAARYKATRVGVPLWRYCLWAALGFLLLEGLLLRFNRQKAQVAAGSQGMAA